ncbi:MAG: CcoQ/FixQ family Cbb3-type cytochrome c oxidase assembly chaperone [Flavobacteriales bacterium]|nr:CcoQ/FixQ family Cbb3-type cytochrome c oxidase assembly chaperone [Flavobacteriales bacterium]
MLKFIKHHMTSIAGIEIFPVIGFILFFTFFLGMLWYVLTFSRRHVAHMERMPLQDHSGDAGPIAATNN